VLNWNRPGNSSAVVNFANAAGANAASGQMGSFGRVLFSTDPVTTQNLLGPWAVSIREFAGYQPGVGVGAGSGPSSSPLPPLLSLPRTPVSPPP
jgi:hypothetical protein